MPVNVCLGGRYFASLNSRNEQWKKLYDGTLGVSTEILEDSHLLEIE